MSFKEVLKEVASSMLGKELRKEMQTCHENIDYYMKMINKNVNTDRKVTLGLKKCCPKTYKKSSRKRNKAAKKKKQRLTKI